MVAPGPNFGPKRADTRNDQPTQERTVEPLKRLTELRFDTRRYRTGCPPSVFKTGALAPGSRLTITVYATHGRAPIIWGDDDHRMGFIQAEVLVGWSAGGRCH